MNRSVGQRKQRTVRAAPRLWRKLASVAFVLDRHDRIVYIEYVADQLGEPDYLSTQHALKHAAGEGS